MIEILNTYLDDFIPLWHNRREYVQYHVLVLVTEGQLIYRLNRSEFKARKGDLIFIPAGTEREALNDGTAPHQKYAATFRCRFEPGLPLLDNPEPVRMHVRSPDYFKERFMQLHRQTLEKRSYFETVRTGIMLEMLGTANRELDIPPLPKRKAQFAARIEQYILQHFREPVTLKELAALIDRSPNYTLSLFKEAVGQTPLEYMHRLRISAAIEMLQNTGLTVAAIAEHLGYYDASYFYKIFKKMTGRSPTSYVGRV